MLWASRTVTVVLPCWEPALCQAHGPPHRFLLLQAFRVVTKPQRLPKPLDGSQSPSFPAIPADKSLQVWSAMSWLLHCSFAGWPQATPLHNLSEPWLPPLSPSQQGQCQAPSRALAKPWKGEKCPCPLHVLPILWTSTVFGYGRLHPFSRGQHWGTIKQGQSRNLVLAPGKLGYKGCRGGPGLPPASFEDGSSPEKGKPQEHKSLWSRVSAPTFLGE